MPKKVAVLFSTLVFVLGSVLLGGTSASAAVQNCDGYTVVSANYVRDNAGQVKGAVQLCRRGNEWFAMFFYYGTSLPSGHIGTARLFKRSREGIISEVSNCDDYADNAHGTVTTCMTKKTYATGDQGPSYRARGELYSNRTGTWVKYAEGSTQLCYDFGCV